jgi:hypothetical protein
MAKTLVFSTTKFTLAVQTIGYFAFAALMLYPFDFYNDEFLLTKDTEAKTKQILLCAIVIILLPIGAGARETTILITTTRLAGYLACYFEKCHDVIQIGCGIIMVGLLCAGIFVMMCIAAFCLVIFKIIIEPHVQNIKLNAWGYSKVFLAAIIIIGTPITYSDLTTHSITALDGEEKLIVLTGMTSYITAAIILKIIIEADLKMLTKIKSQDWLLINLIIVFWATILGLTPAANYVFGLQSITYYSPNIITFSKGIILLTWPAILISSICYLVANTCFVSVEEDKK